MTDHDDTDGAAPSPAPELDDRERDALAAWPAPSPPAGFAERVTAAATAAPDKPIVPVEPRRAGRSRVVLAAVLGAAVTAAAAGVIAYVRRPDVAATSVAGAGAVTVGERRSIAIGGRGVVVAEPGTVLAWTVDASGAARVEHGAGNGFYRVDHGRPFVVTTPLGEVTVTGTCFRIEVIMKPSKQSVIGGAIGATLAAAVVITVYEGGVVVAGTHGSSKVAPGERATLTAEGAPAIAMAGAEEIAPPADTATRDQLLARDQIQRQRIAGLSARVDELQREIAEHGGGDDDAGETEGGRPWIDPGPDQLALWAKQCKVRFDMPPITGTEATQLGPERAQAYGLTPDEIDPVNAVYADLHKRWADRIRAIYGDVVGEGADSTLSAQAMMQEIEDKSPSGEQQAIQARIAQERAGLAVPPADWSHASPIERLMRSLAGFGDEAEAAIAKAIGPDRAHALRMHDGGWPSKMQMSGCNDDPSK